MPKIPFDIIDDRAFADIPDSVPDIKIPLAKVGISNRPHYISVLDPFTGDPTRLRADIKTSFSLPAGQRGLHMSRIEGALHKMASEKPIGLQEYTDKLCEIAREAQAQDTCRIELWADYEIEVDKNASKRPSYEMLKLYSAAEHSGAAKKTEIGITVPFINACPCTQRWGMKAFYEELKKEGYEDKEIFSLIEKAPLQAHTNGGEATLILQTTGTDYETLYSIMDKSVVIIRELLSGQDEHFAVREAHEKGQFCEDNIRGILKSAVDTFDGRLDPETFMKVHVEVNESVHFHNLFAAYEDTLRNTRENLQ